MAEGSGYDKSQNTGSQSTPPEEPPQATPIGEEAPSALGSILTSNIEEKPKSEAPKVIHPSKSGRFLPHVPPEVGSSPPGSQVTLKATNGKVSATTPQSTASPPHPPKPAQYPGTGEGRINGPSPVQPTQPYTPFKSLLSRAYSLPREYKLIAGGVAAAILIAANTLFIDRYLSRPEPLASPSAQYESRKEEPKAQKSLEQKALEEPKAPAQPQTQAQEYLSGTLVSKLSTASKTGLEKIILHGEPLFQARNQHPQEGEKDFVFYPESSTLRVVDENNKTELEPKEIIIPTLAYNSEGKPATSIDLTTEGPYGLKININDKTSTKGITAKVVKDDDIPRKLDLTTITVKVAGSSASYFIPAAEKPSKDCRAFYFVPTEGTKRVIYPNGSVTLTNEKGIYEPKVVSAKEYAKRAQNYIQQAPQVNHPTGRGTLR